MVKRFLTAFIVTTLITCGYFYYVKSTVTVANNNSVARSVTIADSAAKAANDLQPASGNLDPSAAAPFQLTDQNGKKVTEKDLQGKKLLVYFGFTQCQDICPVSMAVITEVMNQLDNKTNIQPVFISIDPKNDTPQVLKNYLKDYSPKFIALTGDESEIDKLKKSFRVYAENSSKGNQPSHSNLIYYMDENGKYLSHFTSDNAPEDIADYISSH